MTNFLQKAKENWRRSRLAGAERYIRQQTALYRHYCIDEVQRHVALFTHISLTAEEAITIVQKIRDEYGMGPISAHNLPGYQENDNGNATITRRTRLPFDIDEAPLNIELHLIVDSRLLNEIHQLAEELQMTFTHGLGWFDLRSSKEALFTLHGTYQYSDAGIAAAYGDLVRYRDRIMQQPS